MKSKQIMIGFIVVILLKILGSLIELVIPLMISQSFDLFLEYGLERNTILSMVCMTTAIIIAFIFNYAGNYLASINANKIVRTKREKFINNLSNLNAKTFDTIDKKKLLTVLNFDFNNYFLFFQNIQRVGIRGPVLLIGAVVLCSVYSYRLAIPLLIVVPLVVMIVIVFSLIGIKANRKLQISYQALLTDTKDALAGAKEIRVYDTINKEKSKFYKDSNELKKKDFKSKQLQYLSNTLTTLLLDFTFFGLLILASKSINIDITIGNYLSFIALFGIISHSSISISKLVIIISRGQVAMANIKSILPHNFEKVVELKTDDNSFIKVDNLCYRSNFSEIFTDLSFKIEGKTNIEIIGPIGCGKTTLMKLLTGLYDSNSGLILFGGKSPNYIREHCTDNMGYVWQNDFIFNNSILYNITLGREYRCDELNLALNASNADVIVNKKREGLDTIIGGASGKISGGEKTRILLARALLKNPMYLFIDNALSSLDYETEKMILNNINLLYPNTSLICVTQKLLNKNDYFVIIEKNKTTCGFINEICDNEFFSDFVSERTNKYGNQ